MKKSYKIIAAVFLVLFNLHVYSQAFRKGSLLVSISEGSTFTNYSTTDISAPKPVLVNQSYIHGERDPLILEYGISNRWGFGMTMGTDNFKINPADFYGFPVSNNVVKSSSNEFTFDANYHVFVNKRLDLSVFTSLGMFSIAMKGNDNDISYNYNASGNIIRVGTRARYYFWRRLGAFGMLSSYSASCQPKDKDSRTNTVGKNYSTALNGLAIEAGLCYRIIK
jgi:hypothetical protein